MVDNSYATLARAFDAIAIDYDRFYGAEGNQAMGWFRSENLALLEATFPLGSSLLEIGCGTGEEALHLARAGYRITATDVSPQMVAITRRKVQAAGLGERITTQTSPAGQLQNLAASASFDGAYASFGSLNCEPDLPRLASALDTLLKPGAPFVCSVMARISPFEITWYMAHLRPRMALRRLRPGWQQAALAGPAADRSRVEVPVRYLSSGDLAVAFAPFFTLSRSMGLGLVMPPPYLDPYYRRHRSLWGRIATIERGLRQRWPWRGMGDHIALVFRKR
jgi:SAM-dependent methyltransferase